MELIWYVWSVGIDKADHQQNLQNSIR